MLFCLYQSFPINLLLVSQNGVTPFEPGIRFLTLISRACESAVCSWTVWKDCAEETTSLLFVSIITPMSELLY